MYIICSRRLTLGLTVPLWRNRETAPGEGEREKEKERVKTDKTESWGGRERDFILEESGGLDRSGGQLKAEAD